LNPNRHELEFVVLGTPVPRGNGFTSCKEFGQPIRAGFVMNLDRWNEIHAR